MKKVYTLVCLVFLLCVDIQAQEDAKKQDPDFASFELASISQKLSESGRPWSPFLQGENLLTGVYMLKAGADDGQSPHDTDEVYYVVSGTGKFKAGEEEVSIKPGSILFVKAEVEHRFFDIEEDLVLLVFFDK